MQFTNIDTSEAIDISLVDPKTGVDIIDGVLQLEYDQELLFNNNGGYDAHADAIAYYQKLSAQYQKAYDLIYDIETYGNNEKNAKLQEIIEGAQYYEAENWADCIIQDLDESGLV